MRIGTIVAILAIFFIIAGVATDLYVDWLWFGSLGQSAVYTTSLTWRVGLFAAGALITVLAVAANYLLARLLAPSHPPLFALEAGGWQGVAQLDRGTVERALGLGVLGLAAIGALTVGGGLASRWDSVARAAYAQPFGLRDPLFGEEISTYVFFLPVWHLASNLLLVVLLLSYAGPLAIYAFRILGFNFQLLRFDFTLPRRVRAHLGVGLALFFLLLALRHRLAMYDLLLDQGGLVPGATYTDINARLPALWLLVAVMLSSALLSLLSIPRRDLRLLWFPAIGWPTTAIVGLALYPAFVQQVQVLPSELAQERPYIEQAIAMTRGAYGLDRIAERLFPAAEEVRPEDLAAQATTLENIRLWDDRPLLDTYNQIQTIRQYYEFVGVDIDRYLIGGRYRQVMLAARELSRERLPAQAQTWVNQRLQYTHGYGVVMTPVSEVVGEGLPSLILRNIPPVGELAVKRPEIYFGEKTAGFVIVGTREREFDYPSEEGNVFATYAGRDGVALGSLWGRLLFSWYFNDANIALSTSLTPESRILFRRTVRERLRALAPFLVYDNDPYLVLVDGRLGWMQDAYTTTDRFPYAASYRGRLNYIRNSVKAVVDAYDGTVQFYVADPDDPIIQAYRGIFPTLFQPLSDMPPGLLAHIRYPEDLFRIQADILRMYHMTDPQEFYNREDVWALPKELFIDQPIEMEPYYVIARLPESTREEFILMIPFTPQNRDNMISWLGARSDPPNYGQLTLFVYPKDRLIFGPMQIEARINQDPRIASQLALWQQRGTRVLRGNTLVIPIGPSNLYVEPLYLLAERGQIPELQRVLVATGSRIVMAPTLAEGLTQLMGGRVPALAGPAAPATSPPGTAPPPLARDATRERLATLARTAQNQYTRGQEALRGGDWARYGEDLRALEATLREMAAVAGSE